MAVLVSDSFNRANSTTTLGTTDSYNGGTVQTWQYTVASSWGISSNQAYIPGSAFSIAYVNAGSSDASIYATMSALGSAGFAGLSFRLSDVNNYWRLVWQASNTTLYLQKCVAGSITTVYSASVPLSAGQIVKVTCSGSTIQVFVNGTSQTTVTDSFNSIATNHGLASSNTYYFLDNFEIDNLSTGGTNASITSVVATSTASALAPTVSTQANITAVVANAQASAGTPNVTTSSALNVSISSVVASATAQGINPTLSTGATIQAVVGASTANALPPVVGTPVTVNAVVATSTANGLNPSVSTDVNIVASVANATAAMIAPTANYHELIQTIELLGWLDDTSKPTEFNLQGIMQTDIELDGFLQTEIELIGVI